MATVITNNNIKQLVRKYINSRNSLPADLKRLPIGKWNVSRVTNMSKLFEYLHEFNDNINDWDVSNVTNMSEMFAGCEIFNQPLNKWNVGNVTNMNEMFSICENFNQPLNSWNVSKVTIMSKLFAGCSMFNQPLNNWNVSKVTKMNGMFYDCENFNQPLNNWKVGKVDNMSDMFVRCSMFNQPLNNWDVSKVTKMNGMFYDCENFNQPLNNWNVGKVTNMSDMFVFARMFNQPLNNWNVSQVTNMSSIFKESSSFDQDLSRWNVSNVRLPEGEEDGINGIFRNCPIREEYKPIFRTQLSDEDEDEDDWVSDEDIHVAINEIDEGAERIQREQALQRQTEINTRVAKRAREEVIEESEFPECVICSEPLNNVNGPGRTSNCRQKCNDAVKVCAYGHIFHRGCILNACNAPDVETSYAPTGILTPQRTKDRCPICRKPLIMGCQQFQTFAQPETEEALKEYKRQHGGNRRMKRRQLTKRKPNKRKLTKRTNKRRNKRSTKRK